ncbi:hypothetical protein R3P38DRAFT_2794679 [Favolaschia claudopus]|uniref:Uncharacterized protein n=1 Tax=Favolaschia claudopus TaxID=2862362 RepID=A0AAW0A9I4_9AGAR
MSNRLPLLLVCQQYAFYQESPLSDIDVNTSWQTASPHRSRRPLPHPPVNNENQLPLLEYGDARIGTRTVLCTLCSQYVKHGYDVGGNPMDQHQKGSKCRVTSCSLPADPIQASAKFLPVTPNPYASSANTHCQGAEYKWDVGYILDTYPLPIHRARSRRSFASDLSVVEIDLIRAWSHERPGKKPIDRLSRSQLEEKMEVVCRKLQTEQTKTLNTNKYLARARKRNNAYRLLLDSISTNDIPGLPRLLCTAKTEGWSPSKTMSKVSLAKQGKYRPRNYTDLDMDLAILIYELGGDAALYALNKSPVSLPSRHTIADKRREINLRITVGDVKLLDIMKNIEMLFNNIDVGEHDKVLHTLSQDEIAGDERPCYLTETDEIAGLCEHAAGALTTFKMGSDLTSVKAAVRVQAIKDGRRLRGMLPRTMAQNPSY